MRRLIALLFFALTVDAGIVSRVENLVIGKYRATAHLLPDGRVVVIGGVSVDVIAADLRSLTRIWTTVPIEDHAVAELRDGRLLIAGGSYTGIRTTSTATWGNDRAAIFDPATDAVEWLTPLNRGRMNAEATLLADGRVLITGGAVTHKSSFVTQMVVAREAEIFDPATGSFRVIGPMLTPRHGHTATLLADGRVLITGGLPEAPAPEWPEPLDTTEIFDPVTETFVEGPPMLAKRTGHTATRLDDGRVLIAGGRSWLDDTHPSSPSSEVFDGQFTVGPDIGARFGHTATVLRDGRVLFFGGASEAVVYDPRIDAIVGRVTLETVQRESAATLLADGSVLIVGGIVDSYNVVSAVFRFIPTAPRRRAVR